MFKIPNWEDDVPKSNIDFGKTGKNKKENKLVQVVKSPQKTIYQQNHNKAVKKEKINKKKKINSTNNTNTVKQSKESNFSNFNKHGNNNSSTLKNKSKQKQQNAFTSKQQKQNPSKNMVNNNQRQLNRNTKQSGNNGQQRQLNGNAKQSGNNGHPPQIATDQPKKKKSKKRKLKNLESASPNDTQLESDNIEETIDISDPSKPKKRKYNDDLDQSSTMPTKKKIIGSESDVSETEITPHLTKVDKKKEKFRKLLQVDSNRNSINISGNKLRERMLERLKAAQFRFLNEKLYTTSGSEAQQLFTSDPEAFRTYHQGYQQQLKKWPVNPLDLIVKRISKMPKTHIIADMGCGEAALSKRVQQPVRSFDLVASAAGVQASDMAHTPLLADSVDVAVYCLALMGTELTQYLVEANRVLKVGGHLLIAEVESRFDKVETFTDAVQKLGFKLKNLDKSHQLFYFMEFTKLRAPPAKKSKLPALTLKPCLYKKR